MDELGKSIPVGESLIETELAAKPPGNTHCLNCGAPLLGSYCSQCGQKDLPRRQAIGDMPVNFIGSFFSFESKFFKTFGTLLVKPGKIINEYNEGKRERYYHPARMYVFLSFIFFLLFALMPDEEKVNLTEDGRKLSKEETARVLDTLKTVPWQGYTPKTIAEYDSIQNTKPLSKRDGKMERYFQEKYILLKQKRGWDDKTVWKSFGMSFQNNIPKMIFLLLPVFALLLKLLYIRRDFYYSEHLVFSVFYYDFLFLAGILGLLFSQVSWLEWLNFFVFLYINFYLYRAMRKVYGQSRLKTMAKFFVLISTFFFCLISAFVINAVVTLILL